MEHRELRRAAGERIPYGSAVEDRDGALFALEILVDFDWENSISVSGPIERMAGVIGRASGRPRVGDGRDARCGDIVSLKTDGTILMLTGRKTEMVILADGKPVGRGL